MRLSNFFKIVFPYIASIHDKKYLCIFSTKSYIRFDMKNIILLTIKSQEN